MTTQTQGARNSGELLFLTGVTIVDTHSGALSPDRAMLIEGGTIATIAPAATFAAPPAVRTIEAPGKYVVPGFLDLHAHPLSSSDPEGSLTLLLANGITGFREMAALGSMLADRRAGTLMPPIDAPALLELASAALTPANAADPETAVSEVRRQQSEGADFIKIIDYTPDVFEAVAAECERLNIKFLGHLSPALDARVAVERGMQSIEHLGPMYALMLSCSTEETKLRSAAREATFKRPTGGASPEMIARLLAFPTLSLTPDVIANYRRVIDTYSEAKCWSLAEFFATSGTWQVPTLIRLRTMTFADDEAYRNDGNLVYVPAQQRRTWQELSKQFATTFSPEARATLRELFALTAGLVKPFDDAGVSMMAGSDSGGGFVVPGFSLHQEFDLLAEAGLSPLEILQMTTLNGARYLGREATMGSVAVGKTANLVLLDGDPTASVANLHRVSAVIRDGAYHDAVALAAMKQRTKDRVATAASA